MGLEKSSGVGTGSDSVAKVKKAQLNDPKPVVGANTKLVEPNPPGLQGDVTANLAEQGEKGPGLVGHMAETKQRDGTSDPAQRFFNMYEELFRTGKAYDKGNAEALLEAASATVKSNPAALPGPTGRDKVLSYLGQLSDMYDYREYSELHRRADLLFVEREARLAGDPAAAVCRAYDAVSRLERSGDSAFVELLFKLAREAIDAEAPVQPTDRGDMDKMELYLGSMAGQEQIEQDARDDKERRPYGVGIFYEWVHKAPWSEGHPHLGQVKALYNERKEQVARMRQGQ